MRMQAKMYMAAGVLSTLAGIVVLVAFVCLFEPRYAPLIPCQIMALVVLLGLGLLFVRRAVALWATDVRERRTATAGVVRAASPDAGRADRVSAVRDGRDTTFGMFGYGVVLFVLAMVDLRYDFHTNEGVPSEAVGCAVSSMLALGLVFRRFPGGLRTVLAMLLLMDSLVVFAATFPSARW